MKRIVIFTALAAVGCGGAGGPETGSQKAGPLVELGENASLHGRVVFPASNPWNTPIDKEPVDPNSDLIIDKIGRADPLHPDFGANWNGGPFGIPYFVVNGNVAYAPITFQNTAESDPGPYRIPPIAPVEGGFNSSGDRHVIIVDRTNWKIYELYKAYPSFNGGWTAYSGAIFDLRSNELRPAGWTSADAAGLPIFPGLVRYDEVFEQGEINHAIRFTVEFTRRGYVFPARHFASDDTDPLKPPMGMRVRLKSTFDISGFSAPCQVILRAMKKYGMIVADNGTDWYFSGAPDFRWDDEDLSTLKDLTGDDFEVVKMGPVTTE